MAQAAPATRPTALVVGAGPAGIISAISLNKRGFDVTVVERRDQIPPQGLNYRSYPMSLSSRSMNSMKAAGLDIMGPGRVRQEGMCFNGKRTLSPAPDEWHKTYIVDRTTLGWDMAQAAQAQSKGITWTWGLTLDSVDWGKQVATFAPSSDPDDGHKLIHYDLLVGADGASSAVRQALADVEPKLKVDVIFESGSHYKTFHNLPQESATLKGLMEDAPRQWIYFFRQPGSPSCAAWKAADSTVSGMLSSALSWDKPTLAKALEPLDLPAYWKRSIVEQTCTDARQEPAPFGRIVELSQMHGPHCVLVGDAAHPVTSTLGQGCNLALESAITMIETLDAVGGNLDRLPAAFTAARMQDVRAFQQMELNQTLFMGSKSVPGLAHPLVWALRRMRAKFIITASMISAMVLAKLNLGEPGIMGGYAGLRDSRVPMSKVLAGLYTRATAASVVAVVLLACSATLLPVAWQTAKASFGV